MKIVVARQMFVCIECVRHEDRCSKADVGLCSEFLCSQTSHCNRCSLRTLPYKTGILRHIISRIVSLRLLTQVCMVSLRLLTHVCMCAWLLSAADVPPNLHLASSEL